ncbi:3-phosphoserine/phosphohydroxythreonine transaminase [Alkalihalobacillus sp. 1P02AB]|uniref:3-phosphoserine/phosphohydroxythreonine transaminase n=1 Tax=Alkalihalobacillus sp. 1P02AB TaxID=3132260 RepID=UPI0039A71C81
MAKQIFNFNAGPSALPKPALERAQRELLNFNNTQMSVMELSHRSQTYEEVHEQAQNLLRELLQIPNDYQILFLQGGASLQFTMLPMNLLTKGTIGNYVLTGSWSEKALKEAKLFGETNVAASTKENNYQNIPDFSELQLNENDAYVHVTSNNTIYGTQYQNFPEIHHAPLIADMSSDILSRPLEVNQFGMIYAGAQKNLGPSGVTVVIIQKDLLKTKVEQVPTMLQYATHIKSDSLYNTPPTFAIYMLRNVLDWIKDLGGAEAIAKRNEEKAKIIYDTIDESNGFYVGHAEKGSRSLMNVTFNLRNEELSQQFLAKAKEQGFVGLNGHRSVGGCRASIYNAVPLDACIALRDLMIQFKENA